MKKVFLKDICEDIQYGYTASAEDEEVGPKFLRITDIVPNIIDWQSVPYCRIEEKKFDKYALHNGDIVIARTGATTGYAKYLKNPPQAVFASYLIRIKIKDGMNKRFISHIVQSQTYKDFIKTIWGGAAQPNANAQVLTSFPILLPDITIQNKISSILSAYDDLIENNTRRIRILEEMAQFIYREWFVNFRFPGYEKVKFVNSELGKIPEGWDIVKISDIVQILGGFPFKSEEYRKQGRYGIVTIKNIQDGLFIDRCDNFIEEVPKKMKDYCYLSDGDILLSLTGNIGRVCFVFGTGYYNFLLNQRVAKLVPVQQEYIPFVYTLYRSKDFQDRLISISTGVAQQNLSPIQMGNIKIAIPVNKIVKYYAKLVAPLLQDVITLNNKIYILRRTRDLLLPKLISGELDISDLDIVVREQENDT